MKEEADIMRWSTIGALQLLGDVEDGEREAARLGLDEVARFLGVAKLSLAESIAEADKRRKAVLARREEHRHSTVVPLPAVRPVRRRRAANAAAEVVITGTTFGN